MANLEIQSFVNKFNILWHSGRNACLSIKANAGKASINLSVELDGPHPLARHEPSQSHGLARHRRREKRAADRRAAAVRVAEEAAIAREAEEAATARDAEEAAIAREAEEAAIAKESETDACEAVEASSNAKDEKASTFDAKANNETDKEKGEDLKAEKIAGKIDHDFDLYIFNYWNTEKRCGAQEAIDYIKEKLKQNFMNFNVRDSDQIFKIEYVEISDEEEDEVIVVSIKLKKNILVEHSARAIQNSEGKTIRVSLKSIHR